MGAILKKLQECYTSDNKYEAVCTLIDMSVCAEIEKNTGIYFVGEEQTAGRVCFSNSPDVRPEFRQYFSIVDLLDFVCAFVSSSACKDQDAGSNKIRIKCPENAVAFWDLVSKGQELRKR